MVRRAQRAFDESQAPLLGVLGAFVFAAQMINFPVGVGTSGHLIGGALLSFVLGPAAACVVMTAILAIQALVFQDGGVLALGANLCNMAILGTLAGYLPYRFWGQGGRRNAAIFVGAALSVMVSAVLALSELLLSGVRMAPALIGLSLALFAVSAAFEGGITLAVVKALEKLNPKFVRQPSGRPSYALGALACAALALVLVGVMYASALPDGLEKFAQLAGIASHAKALIPTPLADYEATFLASAWLRKAAAGMAGLALIYLACWGLGRLAARRKDA